MVNRVLVLIIIICVISDNYICRVPYSGVAFRKILIKLCRNNFMINVALKS